MCVQCVSPCGVKDARSQTAHVTAQPWHATGHWCQPESVPKHCQLPSGPHLSNRPWVTLALKAKKLETETETERLKNQTRSDYEIRKPVPHKHSFLILVQNIL